ncbi:hypothetical protein COCOBI_14-3200 [Coccomyxa sp. Obi]|nr:hypothetical protein COCOBI_14-3200 [Coccomyxa sp. Obi]
MRLKVAESLIWIETRARRVCPESDTTTLRHFLELLFILLEPPLISNEPHRTSGVRGQQSVPFFVLISQGSSSHRHTRLSFRDSASTRRNRGEGAP